MRCMNISLTHVCVGSYVHVLGKCIVTMSCSASVESHFNDRFVATSADSDFYFAVAAYFTCLNVQS